MVFQIQVIWRLLFHFLAKSEPGGEKSKPWQRPGQSSRLRISASLWNHFSGAFQKVTQGLQSFFHSRVFADSRDSKGVPLLSCAIRSRHRFFIPLLLGRDAEINVVSFDRGNTALMDACAEGDEGMVQDLLLAGAAVDTRSKNGQTALILAVGKGNSRVASMLLEYGADPEIRDNLGMSAKKYAELFRLTDVISVMDKRKAKM